MPRTPLKQSYQEEITQAFHVFDTHRTGTINANAFKLLLRALGFRVTKEEIRREILQGNIRLGRSDESDEDTDIDLELVLDITSSRYNKCIDPHVEMKINFRLFDEGNKGYIQFSDLKKVVDDVNREYQQLGMDEEHLPVLRDDQIKAMIDELDGDQDSVINFAEFKKIMEFA